MDKSTVKRLATQVGIPYEPAQFAQGNDIIGPVDLHTLHLFAEKVIENFLMENGQYVTNDASREAALAPYKDALAQISLIAQDRTSYDSEKVVTMARLARGALEPEKVMAAPRCPGKPNPVAKAVADTCAIYNRVINHAIDQQLDAFIFLQCWREGNWDGCRECGFEPDEASMRV